MALSNAHPTRTVLIVHNDAAIAEALALALEHLNCVPLQVHRVGDARLVIQGAPALMAVITPCPLDQPDEAPLMAWVAEDRPDLAVLVLCSSADHSHHDLPAQCYRLATPFDSGDLQRALAEARLTAFETSAPH